MATGLDAAVVGVGCFEAAVDDGGRVVEIAPDLVMQAGLVVLDREQVVAAAVEEGLGDVGLAAHGVGGDERAGQREAFEQERDDAGSSGASVPSA